MARRLRSQGRGQRPGPSSWSFGALSVPGKGKIAGRIAAGEPCFIGQLRKYDVDRGSGAIACKEVYQMCGQEVYAHRTVARHEWALYGTLNAGPWEL